MSENARRYTRQVRETGTILRANPVTLLEPAPSTCVGEETEPGPRPGDLVEQRESLNHLDPVRHRR